MQRVLDQVAGMDWPIGILGLAAAALIGVLIGFARALRDKE
jgi:hypothetical protein